MGDLEQRQQAELLRAILIEPQEARFREITGIGETALRVDVTGWHKHVIMAADQVFLFPRHAANVAMLAREGAVYSALGALPFSAPHLLGRYHDDQVSPYPFIAVNRLSGVRFGSIEAELSLDEWRGFLASLGSLIALWHNLDVAGLPPTLHEAVPGWRDEAKWRDRALDAETYSAAVADLATLISAYLTQVGEVAGLGALLSNDARIVMGNALEELAAMGLVLAHRDIHEDQLMVVGRHDLTITGVLDWETAGVDHPVHDFDFGEWGAEIWRWRAEFVKFRLVMWEAYASGRTTAVPHWSRMNLYFSMRQVVWLLEAWAGKRNAPEALGAVQEQLGYLAQAVEICAAC